MSRPQHALAGRDTCSGACETEHGCNCFAVHTGDRLTQQDLDRLIADKRESITAAIERAEEQREVYRRGWRWGMLDGTVLGGLVVAIAFTIGRNWSWPW